jgi:hypothetical protein
MLGDEAMHQEQQMIRWPFSRARAEATPEPVRHRPYQDELADRLYNLLFCDDLELARREPGPLSGPWRLLMGPPPRSSALQTIAAANNADSRARALAASLLRARGASIVRPCTLGVVVEVALQQGLESLAAYADGAVRYIDATGDAAVFDNGPDEARKLAREMVTYGDAFAQRRDAWLQPRLPPPRSGELRVSVLVTDGTRFVDGSFASLQADADVAAIVGRATRLLRRLQQRSR